MTATQACIPEPSRSAATRSTVTATAPRTVRDDDCAELLSEADCRCAEEDCTSAERSCRDGVDDDGDGVVDCEDGDCALHPACTERVCDDGLDSDDDGAVDCADEDCWGWPSCHERIEVQLVGGRADLARTWQYRGGTAGTSVVERAWRGSTVREALLHSLSAIGRIVPNSAATVSCSWGAEGAWVQSGSGWSWRSNGYRYGGATQSSFGFRERSLTWTGTWVSEACPVPASVFAAPALGLDGAGAPCPASPAGFGCADAAWSLGPPTATHASTYTRTFADTPDWIRTAWPGAVVLSGTWTVTGLADGLGGLGSEASCDDSADDDGDGRVDCEDADCVGDPACPLEIACGDGLDDDGDGRLDCGDEDCWGTAACPDVLISPAARGGVGALDRTRARPGARRLRARGRIGQRSPLHQRCARARDLLVGPVDRGAAQRWCGITLRTRALRTLARLGMRPAGRGAGAGRPGAGEWWGPRTQRRGPAHRDELADVARWLARAHALRRRALADPLVQLDLPTQLGTRRELGPHDVHRQGRGGDHRAGPAGPAPAEPLIGARRQTFLLSSAAAPAQAMVGSQPALAMRG